MFVDIHTHKVDLESNAIQVLNLNISEEKNGGRYFSCGLHPWDSANFDDSVLSQIKENLADKNCLALGEIGIDKVKGGSLIMQNEVFRKQLQIADQFSLPVIIHSVKSFEEIIAIKSEYPNISKWVIHGFNKNKELGRSLVNNGFYLSFGSSIFIENSKSRDALKSVSLEKVFFETDDSSYSILDIYTRASQLLGVELSFLENKIFCNFKGVFEKYYG